MDFQLGQIIKMKKPHPCGGNLWEIQRVGMDFRLKCIKCNHSVMLPRKTVEHSFRGFVDGCENSQKASDGNVAK